jgi:tRNA dimethylallyltransferase
VSPFDFVTILGPTASGKTALAARLAYHLDGEVISADSRQIYRGMDIGTGKDLGDYMVNGRAVPVHLTDIVDAGYQYNVFEFQRDFLKVLKDLRQRHKFPVLCGGSGLYIEAVLENYKLIQVPVNEPLRITLQGKTLDELTGILRSYTAHLHNITDIVNEKRALRAIEIADHYSRNPEGTSEIPELHPLIIGVKFDLETRRERITQRLQVRLNEGMVEEVKKLLDSGIDAEGLMYYGLEYKYITLYLTGAITYPEMVEKLNIAIHQFAKRQMTWFRKMERQGTVIHWLDGPLPLEEKIDIVLKLLGK